MTASLNISNGITAYRTCSKGSMYDPRPLETLQNDASLFWVYLRGQWRMASLIWQGGRPSAVSLVPDDSRDSWDICRMLPAIPAG